MNFAFTDNQEAIRETARRFANEKLAPFYLKGDETGLLNRSHIEEMGSLGLVAPNALEEHGGYSGSAVDCGIVMEEIARADINTAYIQILGPLITAILQQNSPQLAAQWVPEIATGRQLVVLGLTEPGAGSDAGNLQLSAKKRGDRYVLNGEKASISLADQADQVLLFTRTGTVEERAGGITAFLVPLDSKGISRGRYPDVGSRSVGRGSIFFDDVEVDAERMVGGLGMGFKQVMVGFDFSRALIGIQCLAPAFASMDETWEYVTQRQAFGQPLSAFQGVTDPLADAETKMLGARLLCYYTLYLRDQGIRHTSEAAMSKWWPPQLAFETLHLCLQLHGHLGYSTETPHQQRLRDVMGLHIGDGTKQIQKMVIARERLRCG